MKKMVSMILLIVTIFAVMTITCSAANTPYTTVDVLVEQSSARSGQTVPSDEWDLSTGKYYGTFEYSANVYGNYLLKTSTGTINGSFTSSVADEGLYGDIQTHTASIIQKKLLGTSSVGSATINRNGYSTVSFPGLTSNKFIYFIGLSKASSDGETLKGTFVLSE